MNDLSTLRSPLSKACADCVWTSRWHTELRLSQNASAPAVGQTATKKDASGPIPTPLERMLANAGPIRNDGSDKFLGMENVVAAHSRNICLQLTTT